MLCLSRTRPPCYGLMQLQRSTGILPADLSDFNGLVSIRTPKMAYPKRYLK